MTREIYELLEKKMESAMDTWGSHDREHVYRVLYTALDIAQTEKEADKDILIAACLLHDIGRRGETLDPTLDHAVTGSAQAFDFLMENGFTEEFAAAVRECIYTHRFRRERPPVSMEAKILFDADKLDTAGTLGIARTLVYKGENDEPLYTRTETGDISDGRDTDDPSFFREYVFKLEKIYSRFFTARAGEIAERRRAAGEKFYLDMLDDVRETDKTGRKLIDSIVE